MSFGLFALLFWTMSFTPGPNMLLAMSFGLSVGLWRALPLVFGAVCGLAFVVVVCGIGVGAVFAANELVFSIFMCGCAAYLLFFGDKNVEKYQKQRPYNAKNQPKTHRTFHLRLHKLRHKPKMLGGFCRAFASVFGQNRPAKRKIRAHCRLSCRHRVCGYVRLCAWRRGVAQYFGDSRGVVAAAWGRASFSCRGVDLVWCVLGVSLPVWLNENVKTKFEFDDLRGDFESKFELDNFKNFDLNQIKFNFSEVVTRREKLALTP